MKSANGIPYAYVLALFENGEFVDETNFYFDGEPEGDVHYIGCIKHRKPKTPYWAGYCDIENGFEAATAKELFNAPYYNGRSIKDRWEEVHIWEIGMIPVREFISMHSDDFPIEAYERKKARA